MKEIVGFFKQRRNIKYSLGIIVFGLIFAFSFQVNKAQVSQILEKPIGIVLGTEEARQYQASGWQGAWAKGNKSILKVFLPEKKTYRMTMKAFSCSPPDIRDQRIEVHFNNVALDRLKFRKTPKWQKFSVDIPFYLLQETNTTKFVYTQDIRLSPVAFDSLEFKNYIFRTKGFYLLLDSYRKRANYLTLRTVSYSFGFAILLWFFWLFYSRFLFRLIGGPAGEAGHKMQFSRAVRVDLWSYLPSVILLLALALFSFFSSYHFVYSRKAFFVLALTPVVTLKLFQDVVKKIPSFLKIQAITFRKFLIRYHKTDLSSAFILDFMLLLVLCAILLMFKAERIAGQVADLAYFLLVIGVVMKVVAFFRGSSATLSVKDVIETLTQIVEKIVRKKEKLNKIYMIFQNYKGRTTERPHFLEGEFLMRYKFASQFTKDKKVLDVGTGLGGGAHYLALIGAKRVLGIDYSRIAIEYAKRHFSLANLEFKVMEAIDLSLPANSFDVIVAFEIIEHLLPKYHQQFLNSIAQLLRSDGVCLISAPNKLFWSPNRSRPCNPYHTKEFRPREFANLLQDYFSYVSLMGIRCINKDYLKQQKKIQQSFRHHVASFFGQYKIVRELLAYIPKGLKQKVTSENQLSQLQSFDFEVSTDDIENCEGLLAVCRKEKAENDFTRP